MACSIDPLHYIGFAKAVRGKATLLTGEIAEACCGGSEADKANRRLGQRQEADNLGSRKEGRGEAMTN